MNARVTLVLMLLFMALGSIAFFDPFHWNKTEDSEKQLFTSLKGAKFEEVELENKGETVRLLCATAATSGCAADGAAEWKLEAPVKDKADASAVTTLLNGVINLSYIEKVDFDGPIDPKEFGLGGEKPKLTVKTKTGSYSLEIGNGSPIGPNVYLKKAGDEKALYVVASYFPQMLEKDVFHWRNKRLFPEMKTDSIEAISWQGPVSVSAKKKDGKWLLESPMQVPGNFVMLEGLASTLAYASAKAPAEKKSGKPVLKIQFTGGYLNLYSQNGTKDLVADAGHGLYTGAEAPFERFKKAVLEYRERRLFPGIDTVSEMEFTFPRDGNKRISLKYDGVWKASGGAQPEEALSQERLGALAVALADAEADHFLPASSLEAKEFQRQKPDVEITLPSGAHARILVEKRKVAVTEGVLPGEVAVYGENFLKLLPIRFSDLYASHNQLSADLEKEKNGNHDDHAHSH